MESRVEQERGTIRGHTASLEMQALKNAELTQRKNELIERLREWKSTTFKKGKSPKKSPGKDSQKENGSMVSLNLNRSSVNVGENTQKRGSVDSGDLRMELEEQIKKEHAQKLVAVTELIKETANEDLNKAIYELHAQLFLNSVQRQHMDELEEKAGTAIQVLTMKHRRELAVANEEKAAYETHANDVVNQLNDQMTTLNELAMKRIEELEQENAKLRET